MFIVNKETESKILSGTKIDYDYRGTYPSGFAFEIPSNKVIEWKITQACNDSAFSFGESNIGKLEIKLDKSILDTVGDIINCRINISKDALWMGNYSLNEIKSISNDEITYVGYEYFNHSEDIIDFDEMRQWLQTDYIFPTSIDMIISFLSVKYDDLYIVYTDRYTLNINIAEDETVIVNEVKELTVRQFLGYAAMLIGGNLVVDKALDNVVCIRGYQPYGYGQNVLTIDSSRIYEDNNQTLNHIDYSIGSISVEVKSESNPEENIIDKAERTVNNGYNLIFNNPLCREGVAQDMLDYIALKDFKYVPMDISFLGDPRLELGDRIEVEIDGVYYSTYVIQLEQSYDGGLITTVRAPLSFTGENEVNNSVPIVNSDITMLKSKVSELDSRIENIEEEKLSWKYHKGDVVKIRGNYSGHLTGSNKNIVFSIPLPKEIDSNVTTATLKAVVTVRCNGTYLLTNASITLSITLDASARQCGNLAFTYISSTSLGGTNNTAVDVWVADGATITFN